MQVAKVDISYQEGGKVYTFSPNGLNLKVGDVVVVDTVRGNELGYVSSEIEMVDEDAHIVREKKFYRGTMI